MSDDNERCQMSDEEQDDIVQQFLDDEIEKAFNPNQPRDPDGRWTTGGNKLTQNEIDAIDNYVNGKGDKNSYRRINRGLIEGGLSAEDRARVRAIDSALAKSQLKNRMSLIRYANTKGSFNADLFRKNIGKEMTLKGFTSTRMAMARNNSMSLRFEIDAPKGAHGLDVSHISKFPEEKEILLPRGSRFRVESVEQLKGKNDYKTGVMTVTINDKPITLVKLKLLK